MSYTAQDHTFVVCAYKENPYLEEAIESVERQTQRGNILVMTSTPNSYIEGMCAKHNLDLKVNTHASSIARDWNFGYDSAETALVTIAHQDDRYEPRFVERVVDAFNGFTDQTGLQAGLAHTDYYELRDNKRVYSNQLLRIKRILNAIFHRGMASGTRAAKRRGLAFGDLICCPSVTFDKTVVGPAVFDVEYANSCDYRTWVNLANRDVPFIYVHEFLMGHRIYAESTTTENIESNVRAREDREVLASLWPAPLARVISSAYLTSQKSNERK